MQVSIEKTSELERVMTVQLPHEQLETKIDDKLKKLQKSVSIKGFRKGKVPQKIVNERYQASVRQEILQESIGKGLQEALLQQEVNLANQPAIEDIKAEPGQDVEFKAKFEVYPEIEITDFAKLKVETATAEVNDADIERVLEKLRKQSPTWKEVNRLAKDGDQVTIDFSGSVDGETDDRLNGKDTPVELGSKMMMEGFEEQLLKSKKDQTVEVKIDFPEKHPIPEFAGKPVVFNVTVKKVCEAELPELNEEFFAKFSQTAKDLDTFKTELTEQMHVEMKKALRSKTEESLFNALLDNHKVTLPASMLSNEIRRIKDSQYKNVTDDQLGEENLNKIKENAEKNLTVSFVVQAIAKENKIEVDNKRLAERIDQIALSFPQPEQAKQMIFSDERQIDMVSSYVLQEQVIDFVLEKAKCSEKTYSYEELVNI